MNLLRFLKRLIPTLALGLLSTGSLLIFNGCSKEDDETALFDLNHFYVSIDQESFEAFRDHPEILSEYFEGDMGMPEFRPADQSANIIYLRGETIYMELMGPGNRFGVPVGVVGIGFSEDSQIPLEEEWQDRIESLFDEMTISFSENSYSFEEREVLWFDVAYVPDTTTTIYTWYSRYNPEFLNVVADESHTEYTREAYLDLARTGQKKVQNITGITLELNEHDFTRIEKELETIKASKSENGDKINFSLGDAEISLIVSTGNSRLLGVEFSLIENHTCEYQLENIEISCENDQLYMRFQ